MQGWLSDDTGAPFIVNFSSAQAEPGNSDGYGENINCMRKKSHAGISKPESACLYADGFVSDFNFQLFILRISVNMQP